MTIREREPRFELFGFPIGSKVGKEIEVDGLRASVEGPENEGDLEGPWRGYYIKVLDPDTVAKRIVNMTHKKEKESINVRFVLLPSVQKLHRDEINQDPIARKIVYWEP